MCTVNIKIDNEKVRRINPNLKNNENIERWVQYCMDEGEQGTGTCPSLENQQVA